MFGRKPKPVMSAADAQEKLRYQVNDALDAADRSGLSLISQIDTLDMALAQLRFRYTINTKPDAVAYNSTIEDLPRMSPEEVEAMSR